LVTLHPRAAIGDAETGTIVLYTVDMPTGSLPNVFFQASSVCAADIIHERFVCLPARDAIRLGPAAEGNFGTRWIPESHADWRALHQGRLTSSRLAGVLNMWAPSNAKTLGFKSSQNEGHRKMISAYEHLSQPSQPLDGAQIPPQEVVRLNVRAHLDANASGARVQRPEVLEEMKLKQARHLRSLGSIDRVRMAWGNAQESSTVGTELQDSREDEGGSYAPRCRTPDAFTHLPRSQALTRAARCVPQVETLCERWHGDNSRYFMEVGLMEPSREALSRLGFGEGDLPPLGSTPDALCVTAASRQAAIELFANPNSGDPNIHVVEIKNSTPFRISRRKKAFELCDRGPRERIDPILVPQLQLHMLASEASSAYLVSRSATKGTNVFEMARDDEYIAMALAMVREFHARYVLKRKVPPKNALSDLKEHKLLLLKTKELAWRAKLCDRIEHAPLEGADLRAFLDDVA